MILAVRHSAQARQSGFILGILLTLMALAGLLVFLVGTSYGAATLLRVGMMLGGEGRAVGVRGSLYQGLSIDELAYRGQGVGVRAEGLRFEVDWLALRNGRLRVVEVSVARLELALPPEPEPEPDEPGLSAPTMPQWPQLPVEVVLHYVAVGELRLWRDEEPLPFALDRTALRARADATGAELELLSLALSAPDAGLDAHGRLRLDAPQVEGGAPDVKLDLDLAVLQGEHTAHARARALGSLDRMLLDLQATGYDLELKANATLAPFSATLPLHALTATVRGVRPEAWLASMPPALLDFDLVLRLDGELWPASDYGAVRLEGLRSQLQLDLGEASRWQGQTLAGRATWVQQGWELPEAQVDLRVGQNRVQLDGALGLQDNALRYVLQLPALAELWPGLAGGLNLQGELSGLPEQHRLTAQGRFDLPAGVLPAPASPPSQPVQVDNEMKAPPEVVDDEAIDLPAALAQGPHQVELQLTGSWSAAGEPAWQPGALGWRGRIERLALSNPQLTLALREPVQVGVIPPAEADPLRWQVGATRLQFSLPHQRNVILVHEGSSGQGTQWRSAGRVDGLVPAWVVAQLPRSREPLALDLSWNLGVAQALEGEVRLRRRSGDITLPVTPPITLGLQVLDLQIQARPLKGGQSALTLNLDVVGDQLGRLSARGQTEARLNQGVPVVTEAQPIVVDAKLALDDLGWLVAFTGDETEVGGRLNGDVRVERRSGQWQARGDLTGSDLRIIRVDDGIRLLNGSLQARFNQDRLDVESLRFTSVIRTTPRNAAVQAWVKEFGEQGYIQASGGWSLSEAAGAAKVQVSRYPLVQRADRFLAGSGEITINATPQRFEIDGGLTVDIGWISIEGSDALPSLASDVVVVRPGEEVAERRALPMRLNLNIDLGNQTVLTGMGLTTGLRGSIQVRNASTGLRGTGEVRTENGRFSIYGQTLVVRQGEVTFQGQLDDPLLDIVAVRPNLPVEAGVQISGTARNPEITLVSFPDVPEEEKLSWLLLGRSPDARGADTGLLLSAAASLLGRGDEPFYQQFGLDELGLRSGLAGSASGILPSRTVAGSLGSTVNPDEATQFLIAGKRLSDALYVTFEQALSGREAVVRASYRISERLSASVQGGTLNGLRLVWSLLW